MNAPLLSLEGVSKTFHVRPVLGPARRVEALRNVSFSIEPGRALALVGESGSGKSTCGRAVIRHFEPSAGTIRFRGADIFAGRTRRGDRAYLAAVQMVFQDPFASLNPTHTIRHHLERPLRLHGGAGDLEARLRRILTDVELDPATTLEKFPHQLSGGQRQRVSFARALAVGAELIVADEPTSMLDVSIRKSVLDLMRRLKEERSIAFLYITHDIATARYIAEETAVMYAGQVVERGPSGAVIGNPHHPYSRLLISAVPDPARRFDAAGGDALAFTRQAEAVRRLAAQPVAGYREVAPGHFIAYSETDHA
ncbi:ABC transporter ATP-binding protein [Nitratireductor sp. ZSWI3]|uniref:ABC transporter ATP-binding protein n=1 Tax=Nitratireductor sp. ZSWI3 TaxID=2966359 RepID=UPI00215022FA|nr:ABC transporter ATP-binding protein [Nitratireductor sp. ZSWI3]MCR4266116.1 ABC transporter ATP-binding protein [Nitratireductor sp. ZSWI3]